MEIEISGENNIPIKDMFALKDNKDILNSSENLNFDSEDEQ